MLQPEPSTLRSPLMDIWTHSEGHGEGVGWLPVLSVIIALGTVIVAAAYALSRTGSESAMAVFWVGLVILYAPAAARFFAANLSRIEAIGLLAWLAIGTYLVSAMRSPRYFGPVDELLHWRTAFDIQQSGHLFTPNELLPVSPFFPGLENAAIAVSSVSGLDIIQSGFLVIGVARIIGVLALYLLFEHIGKSVNVAAVATATYMGASTYVYFDSQFGYESLAIPLAAFSIYMIVASRKATGRASWVFNGVILLVFTAVIVTHHLTSYFLAIFLLIWGVVEVATRKSHERNLIPLGLACVVILICVLWVGWVARPTIIYLSSPIRSMTSSIAGLFSGASETRELFVNNAGETTALFEPIVGIMSVLALGLSLLLGLWDWWKRERQIKLATVLVVCGIVFPALPLMRLVPDTWEAANRLAAFVYVGLGYIVGVGYVRSELLERLPIDRRLFLVPCLTISLLGGVIGGSSPQTRLPGPFRAAAESRAIDNQVLAAADWARLKLGTNHTMAGDRVGTDVMGSYGGQKMVVNQNNTVSVSSLFLSYTILPHHCDFIRRHRLGYLVIDKRITEVVPLLGYYFEPWEELEISYEFVPPVDIAVLEKFDLAPGVSRLYDSGDIVIYGVEHLICEE
jgi:hypothetical protein